MNRKMVNEWRKVISTASWEKVREVVEKNRVSERGRGIRIERVGEGTWDVYSLGREISILDWDGKRVEDIREGDGYVHGTPDIFHADEYFVVEGVDFGDGKDWVYLRDREGKLFLVSLREEGEKWVEMM